MQQSYEGLASAMKILRLAGCTFGNRMFLFGASLAFRVVVPCCDETITGDWLSGLKLGVGAEVPANQP